MDYKDFITNIQTWLNHHLAEIIVSVAVIILFFISEKVVRRIIRRHGEKNQMDKTRILYVKKTVGMANYLVCAIILGFTWGISLSGLSFYFASIFTVVGVALFAHWSILSNLTASVILFFFFPYKIGSSIRIQDGDNSIEGVVVDIKMFFMEIQTSEGHIVSYPNNLAMQKPFFNKDQ